MNKEILIPILIDGRAYTSGELARFTKSGLEETEAVLNKLIDENILNFRINRKRKYYFLNEINSKNWMKEIQVQKPEPAIPVGMRYCRHCYKHLAGYLGVKLTETLVGLKYIIPKDEQYELTPAGRKWLMKFGINHQILDENHRLFTKQCLDFSERKSHLGGHLGDAILKRMLETGMAENVPDSREIKITEKGKKLLKKELGMDIK